jgi:hypothetical protein
LPEVRAMLRTALQALDDTIGKEDASVPGRG